MKVSSILAKVVVGTLVVGVSVFANAGYRTTGTDTVPNVWTRNYTGVLAAAQQTGYPILIVVVNSASCGHCHVLNDLTLNSANFAKMESELTFYKLMIDAPEGGDYNTVVRRYSGYFDSGMYPIIGVLRSNGDMYGSFGNRTTDTRDVSLDIRQLIESLAKEQGADIWSGSGVQPFSEVSAIEADKPTALTWAAKLKGKINGVAFDGNQEVVASFTVNLTAKGKATVKFATDYGRVTGKGDLTLDGEVPQLVGNALLLKYDAALGAWSGNWGIYAAYASSLSTSAYNGVYTSSATNAVASGYVSVTIKNGKGKVSGMVGGNNKVSSNDAVIVLPAGMLATGLGKWASGSDVAFVPAIKAGKFCGGVAVSAGGATVVSLAAFGMNFTGAGSAWSVDSGLSGLSGKVLRIADLEIPVRVVNEKKVAVGDNSVAARLSAVAKTGMFKGSAKLPAGSCRFEGALVRDGQSVYGIGTSYGSVVGRVEIGDAKQ